MRFGTSRRQESRSATGWSITTTEDRIPRLTISRRASSMLGFGLCLWQHNVGSQIPPYVCCRTVQRMGSTSNPAHVATIMIESVIMVLGALFWWLTSRRNGFFSPASFFGLVSCLCMLIFYIVWYFDISRDQVVFTAMDHHRFPVDVVYTTLWFFLGLILLAWLAGSGIRRPHGKAFLSGMLRNERYFDRTLNAPWMLLLGVSLAGISAIHLIDLDKSILWSTDEYLALDSPGSAGVEVG